MNPPWMNPPWVVYICFDILKYLAGHRLTKYDDLLLWPVVTDARTTSTRATYATECLFLQSFLLSILCPRFCNAQTFESFLCCPVRHLKSWLVNSDWLVPFYLASSFDEFDEYWGDAFVCDTDVNNTGVGTQWQLGQTSNGPWVCTPCSGRICPNR